MWCKCVEVPRINLGCLNIPYSILSQNKVSLRVKLKDNYVDFNIDTINDVFILVKKINDVNSNVFTRLSINNGYIEVDTNNSTFIRIGFDDLMISYIGSSLYYQMFMVVEGLVYPLLYGQFVKEKTFLK